MRGVLEREWMCGNPHMDAAGRGRGMLFAAAQSSDLTRQTWVKTVRRNTVVSVAVAAVAAAADSEPLPFCDTEKKSKLDDAFVDSLTASGGWQTGPVTAMAIDEPEHAEQPAAAAAAPSKGAHGSCRQLGKILHGSGRSSYSCILHGSSDRTSGRCPRPTRPRMCLMVMRQCTIDCPPSGCCIELQAPRPLVCSWMDPRGG